MSHKVKRYDGLKYGEVAAWLTLEHDPEKRWPVYVGIDPGASGAIAFLSPKSYRVYDMPVVKVKVKQTGRRKNRTDYDLNSIVNLFSGLQGFKGSVRAAVEVGIPQMGYGKSPYAAFRSGMSYYMWPLFLRGKGFKVKEVPAGVWKKKLGLTGYSKNASLKLARKLFPEAELHLKKFEGRAEALLIAHFLRSEDAVPRR